VFPGFYPAIADNAPMCKSIPVQFNDATTLNYGNVNYWHWDFGNLSATNDTSRIKNPAYAYNVADSFDVTLIVGSDKGCLDTLVKRIAIVDKPAFSVTNDTLICSIDTLQLNAVASNVTGPGTVTWTPNYMIDNVNSFTPLVSPDVTTTYTANYSDAYGCKASDPVTVKVVNNVTLFAAADTTICRTDTVRLRTTSDALHYTWTPAATLNDATLPNPIATPVNQSTTYHVLASIGKCSAQEDIVITTVPYPAANAGKDTTICFGNSVQLQASGGSIYSWTPSRFLSATNIPNPVSLSPRADIRYIVEVRDVLGCPKPAYDTVIVTVARIIANAGPRDTSVVLGQPLQLNATGSTIYAWSPSTWLNNTTIANPIALPQENIEYAVRVSNAQGCFGLDSINVTVYKMDPDLLVPTGFSPGKDNNNDFFRPILIGMKSLDKFIVYNRWGQMVYSTTSVEEGWDGTFKGQEQGTGTYVWYTEGTNYLGKKIKKRGSVILIR
jgi:gliding motility-associated-like protein